MSSFKNWTRDKLKKRFGIRRQINHPILLEWLNKSKDIALSDFEKQNLMYLREQMLKFIDYWNEEELKFKFIGNIVNLANYDTEDISGFADRYISTIVDGEELGGNPDFLVATGKQEVDTPFFCLHEYKKEINNDSPDPAGQCLAAMLVAQTLNINEPKMSGKPIYGTYIIGRNWFFLILEDKHYSISDAFVSTHEDDLMQILQILKYCKQIILDTWGEE
jgi:hypothetical protein